MKISKIRIKRLIIESIKNIYEKHESHTYQKANKKNTHLDKPTSHSYMSGENKDWQGKGPVNKIIYDYLKSLGMIE